MQINVQKLIVSCALLSFKILDLNFSNTHSKEKQHLQVIKRSLSAQHPDCIEDYDYCAI